jgi:hypothetical protein
MARPLGRETIAFRTPTWEGRKVLEWKPRLIVLILVVVLIAVVSGFLTTTDVLTNNWEW